MMQTKILLVALMLSISMLGCGKAENAEEGQEVVSEPAGMTGDDRETEEVDSQADNVNEEEISESTVDTGMEETETAPEENKIDVEAMDYEYLFYGYGLEEQPPIAGVYLPDDYTVPSEAVRPSIPEAQSLYFESATYDASYAIVVQNETAEEYCARAEEMQSDPKFGYEVYTSEIVDKMDSIYGEVSIVKTHEVLSGEYGGYENTSYFAFVPLDYDYIMSVSFYAKAQPGDLETFKTQFQEMFGVTQ